MSGREGVRTSKGGEGGKGGGGARGREGKGGGGPAAGGSCSKVLMGDRRPCPVRHLEGRVPLALRGIYAPGRLSWLREWSYGYEI